MGLPITRSKALTAASATAISLSQTPSGAGNLLINGASASSGVATLDTQRRVLFTFAADESARTFVVYGTNQSGAPIQETVLGAAATAATNLDFLTVTRISINAASAGAITVGTNTVGSGSWQSINTFITPPNIGIQCVVTGTVNYTIEETNYNINHSPYPIPFNNAVLVNLSATQNGNITDAAEAFRVTINSGTGTVSYAYLQGGLVQ